MRFNKGPHLLLHLLDFSGVKRAGCQAKVGQLDVACAVDEEVLGLEITVDVSELMELVDAHEHLGGVEACVFLLEHARVVEQGTEVATRDEFLNVSVPRLLVRSVETHHGEVDMLAVLEGVQEADKPRRLDGSENIALDEDVLDLVHLGECALAHLFESAHFARVPLTSEEH